MVILAHKDLGELKEIMVHLVKKVPRELSELKENEVRKDVLEHKVGKAHRVIKVLKVKLVQLEFRDYLVHKD